MAEAYIVDAVRTAGGRRNGRLAGVHANDLAGVPLSALAARTGIDPAAIEDVVMGCVSQVGEQSMHIGRSAVLASSLPQSVPSVTIDRQCGSSQQAIQFAAQAVMSGTQEVVIAAGIESMSRAPMGSPRLLDTGVASWSTAVLDRFGVAEFSQFNGAELLVAKHGFSREQLDEFALQSHRKAIAAIDAGRFDHEIVPVDIVLPDGTPDVHRIDEGARRNADPAALAALKTLVPDGAITAGNASQICDGASAVLVVSEQALKDHGLTPIARVVNLTVTAGDPVLMLEEPLFATERALKKAGMRIEDIDLYEVNEAFSPVPMAWLRHLGADPERLNVNGGAIALGHPLGSSGTKLMATLINALKQRGKRYGLQTMCEGGGIANVSIIEAL